MAELSGLRKGFVCTAAGLVFYFSGLDSIVQKSFNPGNPSNVACAQEEPNEEPETQQANILESLVESALKTGVITKAQLGAYNEYAKQDEQDYIEPLTYSALFVELMRKKLDASGLQNDRTRLLMTELGKFYFADENNIAPEVERVREEHDVIPDNVQGLSFKESFESVDYVIGLAQFDEETSQAGIDRLIKLLQAKYSIVQSFREVVKDIPIQGYKNFEEIIISAFAREHLSIKELPKFGEKPNPEVKKIFASMISGFNKAVDETYGPGRLVFVDPTEEPDNGKYEEQAAYPRIKALTDGFEKNPKWLAYKTELTTLLAEASLSAQKLRERYDRYVATRGKEILKGLHDKEKKVYIAFHRGVEEQIAAREQEVAKAQTPFYKKWWFWTAVGGAALTAGIITGAALSGGEPTTPKQDIYDKNN